MRTILVGMFLICSLNSFSQFKSYTNISFGADFLKNDNKTLNAKFGGGAIIDNGALLGLGIGVVKIDGIKKVYIPLYGDIGFLLNPNSKIFPFVSLQPGYGIYNNKTYVGSRSMSTTGGFTYYVGAGVGFSSDKNVKGSLQIGYSQYSFETENVKSNINGLSIKFVCLLLSKK